MKIKTKNQILESLRGIGSGSTKTRNHLLGKGEVSLTDAFERVAARLANRLGEYSPLFNVLKEASRQTEKVKYGSVEYNQTVFKIDNELFDTYKLAVEDLKNNYFDNNEVIDFMDETMETMTEDKLESYKKVMAYLDSGLFECINKR